MQYGVQRRSIYLVPPSEEERRWIFDLFETEEVWAMFGFESPSRTLMEERAATGQLILGIVKRLEGRRRIGFVVSFPPTLPANAWEFGLVIPDPRDRDGYSAIHASDATAHYTFDHLRIERAMWRIRADNRRSEAIARRMGYRPYGGWDVGGHRYNFYRLTPERWAERYAQLDRLEGMSPFGLPDTFVALASPPFDPLDPEAPAVTASSCESEGAERPA